MYVVPRREHQRGGQAGAWAGHNGGGARAARGVKVDAGGPTLDSNCGVTTLGTTRLPPDLLLVFDKSGSMAEDPATGNNCNPAATCPSKWNQAKTAINTALDEPHVDGQLGPQALLGHGQLYVAAGAQVNIGANTAAAITDALGRTDPAGNTPTTLAAPARWRLPRNADRPQPEVHGARDRWRADLRRCQRQRR